MILFKSILVENFEISFYLFANYDRVLTRTIDTNGDYVFCRVKGSSKDFPIVGPSGGAEVERN